MKTELPDDFLATPEGEEANRILRSCVHCGFCNATCPTYQLLGDELDGPRGRIYLIKQVLEGREPGPETQRHLDRCLTCRNCETTCPSGVRYSRLLDIGRARVERAVPRPASERLKRAALRRVLLERALFTPLLRGAQTLRPLLGPAVPGRQADLPFTPRPHARKVLLVPGCVQPALRPRIDTAARIVLDRLGIECLAPPRARCCGALSHHLNAADEARDLMRANIDAWWPLVEVGGIEALTMTASGCGVAIRDYAQHFAHDPDYADKAQAVSELYRDPAEIVAAELAAGAPVRAVTDEPVRIAFHPPCTLQHGLRRPGIVEPILEAHGYSLLPFREGHLCCGSAGTYSITQPAIARRLRQRKLDHLLAPGPELVATANIGCLLHLQAGTETPVRHWLELLA